MSPPLSTSSASSSWSRAVSESSFYTEIKLNYDAICIGAELGKGSFGSVFRAIDSSTGRQYAVKRLRSSVVDPNQSRGYMDEVRVMRSLSHANIVQYLGVRTDEAANTIDIYLEFVSGGSVAQLVSEHGPLASPLVRRFAHDMVSGIKYLHSKQVIHRDIKGANVLVTTMGVCKLADFGCSKLLGVMNTADRDETLHHIRGSVPWMAPEVVRETSYHLPADIWSLGATVVEMVSGKRPWPEVTEQLGAIFKIGQTKKGPPIPDTVDDDTRRFIQRCFAIEPSNRPSARELLFDPFFTLH